MRALVDGDIRRARWDELGTIETDGRAVQRHVDRILALPVPRRGRDSGAAVQGRAGLRARGRAR